jgi:hypothetical protein
MTKRELLDYLLPFDDEIEVVLAGDFPHETIPLAGLSYAPDKNGYGTVIVSKAPQA